MELQTIFVYLTLTLVLAAGAYYTNKKGSYSFLIASLFVYALTFGLRSGVGVDFWGYKGWYDDALMGVHSYDHVEIGFRFLIDLCAALRLPFSFFLGLVAFLQLFLVYYAIKPFKKAYPFLSLTFMLGCIWLSYANGLRQQLAFCVFAYSIQFIADKKWIKHYICIAVAAMFHLSAVILVIAYPLYVFRNEWFKRVWLQIGLLFAVLAFSNSSVVNQIANYVDQFADVLGYDVYFQKSYDLTQTLTRGIGYWINMSISICLIIFSSETKAFYKSRTVNIIYDLFFFGVLWRYLFINSLIFSRVNYYFAGFEYILAALTLAYLWPKQNLKKMILIALYALVFIATLYRMHTNTALFMFNWQTYIM